MVSIRDAQALKRSAGAGGIGSNQQWPALLLALFGLAVCWTFFAWASNRGFTLGDDANYLIEASQAATNRVSLSQYASFWYPLYTLAGGGIALYRIFGFIVLQCCAATFGYALARYSGLQPRATVLVCAIGSCCFYNVWLPTPSYNLLNLSGILVFLSGLLLSAHAPDNSVEVRRGSEFFLLTAILVGVGLAVTFLSKPPSFILAAMAGITWTWNERLLSPFVRGGAALLVACLLLLLVAFLVDGGPAAYAARIQEGLHFLNVRASQGQGYGILNSVVGPLMPGRLWKLPPVAALACVLLALFILLFWLVKKRDTSSSFFGAVLAGTCLLAGGATLVSRALDFDPYRHFPFNHLWYLMPPLAFVAALAGMDCRGRGRDLISVAVVLSGLIIFGFGTNSTLIRQIFGASVFWFGGLLMLVSWLPAHARSRYLQAVVALVCSLTVATLAGMSQSPHGATASLWDQQTPVRMGFEGGEIKLDEASARYIAAFQRAAFAQGLAVGTPILDFGAQGPGLSYAMSGTSPGQAWLTFGRPNDVIFARYVLSTLPQPQLGRSWLLTGPGETRQVARNVLGALGVAFPRDYRLVLTLRNPEQGWEHTLWRPVPRH
jgi:hypothetical protein